MPTNSALMIARGVGALLLGVWPLGCSSETEPYRPADDLEWLVAEYDAPRGEISPASLEAALARALPVLGALALVDHMRFVTGSIAQLQEGFRIQGIDSASDLDVNGKIGLHIVCPGDAAHPAADGAAPDPALTGTLELTLPVAKSGLGPAADGTARACRFNSQDVPLPPLLEAIVGAGSHEVRVDGPVALHLGAALALGRDAQLRPLFVIHGELAIEGLPTLTAIDFRLPAPQVLEARVLLSASAESSVIAFSDGLQVGLRERRGTWLCDVSESNTCVPSF